MSAFQGFDKALNLIENVADRDVLNNLGGAPIADDIVLFLNNLRNTSELIVTSSERDGSFIRFDETTQPFVFINGTEITVNGTVFYVGDSNTRNEFRLYSDEALTQLVSNPPLGTYIRSDSVSSGDIQNLVRFRNPVVEDLSLSQIGDTDEEAEQQQQLDNIYTSYIRTYSKVRGGFLSGLSGYISAIDSELDLFNLRRTNSVNSLIDFNTENSLSLSGFIYVSDPDGDNDTSVSSTSGPGIFILDPDTDQATRIFSSNENVWEEDGDDLVAASKEIVVGNFVFDQGARILRKAGSPAITTETDVVTEFTHFVNVVVDGEEYSLCLK
jgi:hypothetical protein